MPNKNYIKGRRKEYKFVNNAKKMGYLAFRSAGSHSPVDVVIIDSKSSLKTIDLVQCKPDSMGTNARMKIEKENETLNGMFMVRFRVA